MASTISNSVVRVISEFTGREVIAFFSANHIDPDTALESFLLAPRTDGDGDGDGAAP